MRIPGTTFSDNERFQLEENKKVIGGELYDFIKRVANITERDLAQNHSLGLLLANTIEELGEYAAAKTVEDGHKKYKRKPKESSLVEAIDLTICALSLVFANGGTLEDLCKTGQTKLNKWDERLK